MADDPDSTHVKPFELLAHDLRIDIVEALVDRRRQAPESPSLAFSELRDRTGVRDSGKFNYHLEKLRGTFVRRTDDGYRLSAAGHEVVGAILAGAFEANVETDRVPVSEPCGYCGAAVEAYYEDGVLRAECEDGHAVHGNYVPPGLVESVSIPTAISLSSLLGHHLLELLLRGVCSNCYGPATATLSSSDDGTPVLDGRCDRCGFNFTGSPGLPVLIHPELRSFFHGRDRDVRTTPHWSLPFLVDESRWTVEATDPFQVSVDVGDADDGLRFLLDEDCSVREYERRPA